MSTASHPRAADFAVREQQILQSESSRFCCFSRLLYVDLDLPKETLRESKLCRRNMDKGKKRKDLCEGDNGSCGGNSTHDKKKPKISPAATSGKLNIFQLIAKDS